MNKNKKAFLVDVGFTVRVVMNVPEPMENVFDYLAENDEAHDAFLGKVLRQIPPNPLTMDHITEIHDDEQCPFGTVKQDREEV